MKMTEANRRLVNREQVKRRTTEDRSCSNSKKLSPLSGEVFVVRSSYCLVFDHLHQWRGNDLLSRAAWVVHDRWREVAKSIDFIL